MWEFDSDDFCSVHPERMFDLKIGDAEVLRNAGGRVTLDMIR